MKCRSGSVTIAADDDPALVASLQVESGAYRLFKRGQPSVLFHILIDSTPEPVFPPADRRRATDGSCHQLHHPQSNAGMRAPEVRPVRDSDRIDTASKTGTHSFIDRCNNALHRLFDGRDDQPRRLLQSRHETIPFLSCPYRFV
ncbi:hypothetical protein LZK73_33245 (plasmid) [Neorhizobium galegae]|nr:hypothetical protein LZK73_33245 [Neorhizobium galegae]